MKKISQKELDNLIKTRIESLKDFSGSNIDFPKEDQVETDFLLAKLLRYNFLELMVNLKY